MKHTFSLLILGLSLSIALPELVLAHGNEKHDQPVHGDHNPSKGGEVGMLEENLHVELIQKGNKITLYLSDGARKPVILKQVSLKAAAMTRSGEQPVKLMSVDDSYTGTLPADTLEIRLRSRYNEKVGEAWFEIK